MFASYLRELKCARSGGFVPPPPRSSLQWPMGWYIPATSTRVSCHTPSGTLSEGHAPLGLLLLLTILMG